MPPQGAHALVPRGFPNPGWPLGGFPPAQGAGQPAGPPVGTLASAESFRVLTTCSWEQSDTMVKVYVPLRGVQTDMLRATFTNNSVEVRPCRIVIQIVQSPWKEERSLSWSAMTLSAVGSFQPGMHAAGSYGEAACARRIAVSWAWLVWDRAYRPDSARHTQPVSFAQNLQFCGLLPGFSFPGVHCSS